MIIEVTNKLMINHRSHERVNGKPAWCELPYPGHTSKNKPGCPNYEKCKKLPRLEKYYDLTKPHWFVIETFDIGTYIDRMKIKHPKWTDKQCRNPLYWQETVRAKLRKRCNDLVNNPMHIKPIFHLIPEAMGLNVILTIRKLGFVMEIKKPMIIRKIALVGFKGDYFKA